MAQFAVTDQVIKPVHDQCLRRLLAEPEAENGVGMRLFLPNTVLQRGLGLRHF